MHHFIAQLMSILVLMRMVFLIIQEMFHGRISLNSVLLLLLVKFVGGFWFELMHIFLIVNIRSYLTHLHSSQLFGQLPQFIKITFFCFYDQNKSSESKVKFRQFSNHCKRVLETTNLAYANKRKSLSLPRNLAPMTSGRQLIVVSTVINLLYLLYSRGWRVCLICCKIVC